PLMLLSLKRVLATSPEIEVIGTAADGKEALAQIERLRPSVVCTDFQMPVMDGLALTREVMARFPCPILVVSAVVGDEHPERVFALLEAGAVDVFPKPQGALEPDSPAAQELIRKIKVTAGVFVSTPRTTVPSPALPRLRQGTAAPSPPLAAPSARLPNVATSRLVVIGSSTGGPQVLKSILTRLPA